MRKKLFAVLSLILAVVFVFSSGACSCGSDSEDDKFYGRTQIITEGKNYLVNDGFSDYKILLNEACSEAEKYAAGEFNTILNMASGVKLDIVYSADINSTTKYISIGNTSFAEAAGATIEPNGITRNGFRIKTYKDGICIVAGDKTGLIYGVYKFFEKNCNYMYYAPDEIRIDKSNTIKLFEYNYEDWPDFLERDVFNYTTKNDPAVTMRYYLNGSVYSKWNEMYGEGTWWSSLYDQSMEEQIVPSAIYGAAHSDWYYGQGGQTNETRSQLCFTKALYDKGDFDAVSSGLMDANGALTDDESFADGSKGLFWTFCYNLIKNYISVETDKTLFQLGMSDNQDFCNCSTCSRDISKYTRTGLVIRFANAVADVVKEWQEKNCPERTIYLTMFAYLTVIEPPVYLENGTYYPKDESLVVRDNIIVRYAPMLEGYLFPLLDEKNNARATLQMNGWKAICKHFAVWDYVVNFQELIQPFPNWMTAYDNLRAYYDYGYWDIFNQGTASYPNLPFYYMDMWIRSRLLWNIHQDYNELKDEFISAFYGSAADSINQYIEKLTFHYLDHMKPLGYNGSAVTPTVSTKNYSVAFLESVKNVLDIGFDKINADTTITDSRKNLLTQRLEYETVFYKYAELKLYSNYFSKSELSAKLDDFERICKQGNIGGTKGYTSIYDDIAAWRSQLV